MTGRRGVGGPAAGSTPGTFNWFCLFGPICQVLPLLSARRTALPYHFIGDEVASINEGELG
jgi:hypothetical protein